MRPEDAAPMLSNRSRLAGVLFAVCLVSACGSGKKTPSSKAPSDRFAASNFGDPTRSSNKWLPLKPGTQWVREGRVNIGHRRLTHRVVSTVTDVSKKVDGVLTVGVVDQDFNGGQIGEQSVDWFGEDKQGNVWDLGSYTESY